MARARNIKPAFFKNELLGQADPLLSLLFVSLWTLADRDGRLEDRPLRIKAETFPYREVSDFNGYLTQLEQHGFIERYKVGDLAIIQIVNFRKHQAPHNTEKPSELPEKPIDTPITVKPSLSNDKLTQAKRPDSLIPDSLIPDSLIPDSVALAAPRRKTKTSLPENFDPTDSHRDFAGLNNLILTHELEKFRLHHEAKMTTSGNWNSSFSTWLHNAVEFRNKNTPSQSKRDHLQVVADQLTGRSHVAVALGG